MKRVVSLIFCTLLTLSAFAQNGAAMVDAVQLFADGDVAAARSAFEKMHARDTTDDAVNYYLGLCEYSLGREATAEQHFLAAMRQDSTNCWYIHALATMYDAQRRTIEAGTMCEKLVKMKPQHYRNPYTLTSIADAKAGTRQDSLAIKYYQEALDLDPEYAPAEIGLAEAMRLRGNYPGYFLSLGRFIESTQVSGKIKSSYMKTLLDNVDSRFWWVWSEQLGKLVDRCEEMHPDDIQSHVNQIQMCFFKRDTTAWMNECEKLVPLARAQKDTTNLMLALSVIGDTWHNRGNARKAYETYDEALKVKPDEVSILNNYAYFLSLEKKKLRKALKMSRTTIELEPDNATYLDTYGWILYLLGKPKEAKPHFKRAMIYGGKDSAVVLEHYSIVLDALGEKDLSTYYRNLSEQKK